MTASRGTLLIRADASTQMGTGHVMRCLALAQAWQESGGTAQFAVSEIAPALEERLGTEGVGIKRLSATAGSAQDAEQTIALAQRQPGAWVMVDGYQFSADYQRALKEAGLTLLVVDDYVHAAHYYADVLLNQNIYAHETMYPNREPYTQLLLGTRYALLRREFWPWRGWQREIAGIGRRVLVTLGGGDPDNVTRQAIVALEKVDVEGLEVIVLVGASNPHFEELELAFRHSRLTLRLERNTSNMPELLAWADVAISAGGSTCWELAFFGLPSALLILADNQRLNVEGLQEAGFAANLGWHGQVSAVSTASALTRLFQDFDLRANMARLGQQLVDGEGASRVITAMRAGTPIRVRSAKHDDIDLIFQWANDPLTRQMSFTSDAISWEEHQRWYAKIMNAPNHLLMIVELRDKGRWKPVGQVRIAPDGTVSVSLSPRYRGRRLAAPALRAAIKYHNARSSKDLKAYVKPENEPSHKAFTRAGFRSVGQTRTLGQPCLEYVYTLDDQSIDGLSSKGDSCAPNAGW